MARMKFKNSLNIPDANSQDGVHFVKRGGSVDAFLVNNGEVLPIAENEMSYAYGVEIDTTKSSPSLQRVGNMFLHQQLPIQSKMRRCLLNDDGTVNYYLDANDSTKKEDGTPANLDGSDGQVMVELPDMWIFFSYYGNIQRVMVSDRPIAGYQLWEKNYISAYEATVFRPDNKLSSVVTDDVDYRGGNNNSDRDELSTTQLGMPATAISLTNFRNYARNRGANFQCNTYWSYRKMYWLYVVEYANLNSQATFNAQPDANGFKQGGLGAGATSVNSTRWSNFNGYYPIFKCGITNELGNNTGIVNTFAPFGFDEIDEPATTSQNIPSYRGIEHPFGHIWKWTDGLLFSIESEADGGKSRLYVATDSDYSSTISNNYEEIGEVPRANGYVREIQFGKNGDIIPLIATGGGSSSYFCDNWYTSIPSSGRSVRGCLFGGYASGGAGAGLACAYSIGAPSRTTARLGSRLCFPK